MADPIVDPEATRIVYRWLSRMSRRKGRGQETRTGLGPELDAAWFADTRADVLDAEDDKEAAEALFVPIRESIRDELADSGIYGELAADLADEFLYRADFAELARWIRYGEEPDLPPEPEPPDISDLLDDLDND